MRLRSGHCGQDGAKKYGCIRCQAQRQALAETASHKQEFEDVPLVQRCRMWSSLLRGAGEHLVAPSRTSWTSSPRRHGPHRPLTTFDKLAATLVLLAPMLAHIDAMSERCSLRLDYTSKTHAASMSTGIVQISLAHLLTKSMCHQDESSLDRPNLPANSIFMLTHRKRRCTRFIELLVTTGCITDEVIKHGTLTRLSEKPRLQDGRLRW